MNFLRILKESLEILFICVYGYSNNPLGFCFFQPEVPGQGQRRGAALTGQIPARGSAAARGKRCGSFTGSRRTSGWSWGAGRCSEAAARRSRAAAAEVQRQLGCSGEGKRGQSGSKSFAGPRWSSL